MGTDGIDFLQGLDVPHLYKEQSGETWMPWMEQKRSIRSKGMEVTDDDGAVCRAAVQLVSVKTKQRFALIRKAEQCFITHCNYCWRVYLQLIPLDTQRQHNAIMTLQSFLTFVCGAGVPHLSKKKKQSDLKWKWLCLCSFIPKRFQICVEVTLIVLSEDPEKSRSPVE